MLVISTRSPALEYSLPFSDSQAFSAHAAVELHENRLDHEHHHHHHDQDPSMGSWS